MPEPSLPPTPAEPPSASLSATKQSRSVRFGVPKGEGPAAVAAYQIGKKLLHRAGTALARLVPVSAFGGA